MGSVTLWESVLFLFVFVFIYEYSLLVSVFSAFSHVLALVFPSHVFVFMLDFSPNTSQVCVCTIRLFPGFWYIHWTAFPSRFLEFRTVVLICIVINSP